MLSLLFTETVNILRRTRTAVASRDSFNNPVYGSPQTWAAAYTNIKMRVSLTGKRIKWEGTGELIHPEGIIYYSPTLTLHPQDRLVIIESNVGLTLGVEYIITAVWPASLLPGGPADHFQGEIQLPQ